MTDLPTPSQYAAGVLVTCPGEMTKADGSKVGEFSYVVEVVEVVTDDDGWLNR